MNWYFSAEELSRPVREGGTPPKQALKYRRQTCEYLQQLGVWLQLPQLTIATGFVYFHRFFALKDFEDHDRLSVGIACLFLAGKVEETPKKLKDVILLSHKLRHHFYSPKEKYVPLKLDSPKYEDEREKILLAERLVLQTIAFDFIVEHPYKFLLDYVKRVNGGQELAQSAWNFVNDSLRTMLCLQYRPQIIACAAIYLASKRPSNKWWERMTNEASKRELDDISDQILELYPDEFPLKQQSKLANSGPSPLQSPPFSGSETPESVTLSPPSEAVHTPSPNLLPQVGLPITSSHRSHKDPHSHNSRREDSRRDDSRRDDPHSKSHSRSGGSNSNRNSSDTVPPPPPEEPPPPELPPPPPEEPPPPPSPHDKRDVDRNERDSYSRRRSSPERGQNRDYSRKDYDLRDPAYDHRDRDLRNNEYATRERTEERVTAYRYERYNSERKEYNDRDFRDRDPRDRDRDNNREREPRDLREPERDNTNNRDFRDREPRDRDRERDIRDRDNNNREREPRDRDFRDRERDLRDRNRDLRDPRYTTRWERQDKDWERGGYKSDMRYRSRDLRTNLYAKPFKMDKDHKPLSPTSFSNSPSGSDSKTPSPDRLYPSSDMKKARVEDKDRNRNYSQAERTSKRRRLPPGSFKPDSFKADSRDDADLREKPNNPQSSRYDQQNTQRPWKSNRTHDEQRDTNDQERRNNSSSTNINSQKDNDEEEGSITSNQSSNIKEDWI